METRTIFLSSTAGSLRAFRDAVSAAIQRLDGYTCVRMEDFGTRDSTPEEFCRRCVADCDVFVGIVGRAFGSAPEGDERSFTRLEYEAARDLLKPRLMFVTPERLPAETAVDEPGWKVEAQERFRALVLSERVVTRGFSDPATLAELVVEAIHNELTRAELSHREAGLSELLEQHRAAYLEEFGRVSVLGDHPAELEFEASELCYVPRRFAQPTRGSRAPRRHSQAGTGGGDRPGPVTVELPADQQEHLLLAQLTEERACALVEGEGGSGKTEFARHMACRLAEGMAVAPEEGGLVPLFLELASMRDPGDLTSGSAVLAAFGARSGFLARDVGGEPLFDRLLREERLVFILDGLDELRDASMYEDLDRALDDARRHSGFSGCPLLVTGRPSAIARTPRLRRRALKLRFRPLPLERREIEEYVTGFFGRDGEPEARELLRSLENANSSVLRLLGWPLFLTLTCAHWQSGDDRLTISSPADLMRGAVAHLLERRLPGRVEQALGDLGHLAWHSSPAFGAVPHEAAARHVSEESLERYSRRSGLLLGSSTDGYRFAIRPLAEYLAGHHLASREDEGELLLDTYERHAWNQGWREILFWSAGELWRRDRAPLVLGLIERVLDEIEDGRDDLGQTLFLQVCDLVGSGGEGAAVPDAILDRLAGLLIPEPGEEDENEARLLDFQDEIRAWSDRVRDRLAERALDRAQGLPIHVECGVLGVLGSDRGLGRLLDLLAEDDQDDNLEFVISALGRIGNESAVDALLPLLDPATQTNEVIREGAVRALRQVGSPRAVPSLQRALDAERESEPRVRTAAYRAVGRLGGEEAVPFLVEAIERARADTDSYLYEEQAAGLEALAAGSSEAARRALERYCDEEREPDPYVRHLAATSLGRMIRPTVLLPLPDACEDPDLDFFYTFQAASEDAGTVLAVEDDPPREDPLLLGTVLADVIHVSMVIHGVTNRFLLIRLEETDPERRFDVLLPILESEVGAARASVVEAIAASGSSRAEATLIECLADPHLNVKYAAVRGLGEIGTPAARAPLLAWLDPERSPDCDLSFHVGYALLSLEPDDPDLVAACIDFELSEPVINELRKGAAAAFCIEKELVSEGFEGIPIRERTLPSDPAWCCVLVAREDLTLTPRPSDGPPS